MKVTYWYAQALDDNDCYSIRTSTKREAKALKAEADASWSEAGWAGSPYGPIVKVVVAYASGFDLVSRCLQEDRLGYEETQAVKEWEKKNGRPYDSHLWAGATPVR